MKKVIEKRFLAFFQTTKKFRTCELGGGCVIILPIFALLLILAGILRWKCFEFWLS